jgi:hypothetical protein
MLLDRLQPQKLLAVSLRGLKDEFKINTDTYSLKPGGDIYRSKRRCS